ncbi:MAG TPA: trypsin-like serine protease [Pseudonocardiaceae bacterium]
MNKLMRAAVIGGAAVAVGVLPAAGLANAATSPNPPAAPVTTAPVTSPVTSPVTTPVTSPVGTKPAPVKPTSPVTGPTKTAPTKTAPVTSPTAPTKPVAPGKHKPVAPGKHKPTRGKHAPGHSASGHAPGKTAPKGGHRTRAPRPTHTTSGTGHSSGGHGGSGHGGGNGSGHGSGHGKAGQKGGESGKAGPAGSQKPRPTSLILGGGNAQNAPWAAQISWNGIGFECTGTVVAPTWVLTAGHCVSAGAMTVQVGSVELGQGSTIEVTEKQVDPNADLALLRLARSAGVPAVTLAGSDPDVGELDEIYGWGRTSANSGPSSQLRVARVKVTDLRCQDAVGGPAICSTGVTGAAFNGDSGGPEMFAGVQVGVCSTGDPVAGNEQYASVAANRDWIREVALV